MNELMNMTINRGNEDLFKQIEKSEIWFRWYDNQVSQAQRAMRMNLAWTATDIDKQYFTLAELDAEAKIKQEELRELKRIASAN